MYIGNPVYQVAFLTDTFSGDASTTAFTMSVAPANTSSVLVAISGVVQDPSTYSVNGKTLTFTAAPPSATGNISARYLGIPASNVTTTAYRTVTEFTATASQTTFTPPSYTVGFINVYRNGVRLGSADYTASNGTTVVLASGAAAGDLVTTESFLVSSVLNAIPNAAASVGQSNLASGVAGTGPAFSAYLNTNQSITTSTWTKVQCAIKEFDTNSNYDNTTNYRFTPSIAGYYQINGDIAFGGSSFTRTIVSIYKNGTEYKRGSDYTGLYQGLVSSIVYFNGSTDYVELYGYVTATSPGYIASGTYSTWFNGAMVRSA